MSDLWGEPEEALFPRWDRFQGLGLLLNGRQEEVVIDHELGEEDQLYRDEEGQQDNHDDRVEEGLERRLLEDREVRLAATRRTDRRPSTCPSTSIGMIWTGLALPTSRPRTS